MALKYFRGRLDLAKLSLPDLADAAHALATLERLALTGVITFESGASREGAPRPDMIGGRELARPRLQKDILAALREGGAMAFPDLQAATGMKDGSLSANLTALMREGIVLKSTAPRPAGTPGRPRRESTTYSLADPEGSQEAMR